MISSGSCHGPGCTRPADSDFCRESCMEAWHAQFWGIEQPRPAGETPADREVAILAAMGLGRSLLVTPADDGCAISVASGGAPTVAERAFLARDIVRPGLKGAVAAAVHRESLRNEVRALCSPRLVEAAFAEADRRTATRGEDGLAAVVRDLKFGWLPTGSDAASPQVAPENPQVAQDRSRGWLLRLFNRWRREP